MKLISLLTAASLLMASATFAATAAAPAATPAPAATVAPAKHDHHCRDQANEQKLKGAARASFVKKCRADSAPAK